METNKDLKKQRKQKIKEFKQNNIQKSVNYKLVTFMILFSMVCGFIITYSENFIEDFFNEANFNHVIIILIVALIIMLIKLFKDFRKK